MTAADAYDALVATIAALSPRGGVQSHRDTFRSADTVNASSGSRTFAVAVAQLPSLTDESYRGIEAGNSDDAGADAHEVTLRLGIVYERQDWRRMLADADQVIDAVRGMPGSELNASTYSSQIYYTSAQSVGVAGFSDPSADSAQTALMPMWEVTIRYDARNAL